MLSVSYAGKNAYSDSKTSGVLRGNASVANRWYAGINILNNSQIKYLGKISFFWYFCEEFLHFDKYLKIHLRILMKNAKYYVDYMTYVSVLGKSFFVDFRKGFRGFCKIFTPGDLCPPPLSEIFHFFLTLPLAKGSRKKLVEFSTKRLTHPPTLVGEKNDLLVMKQILYDMGPLTLVRWPL